MQEGGEGVKLPFAVEDGRSVVFVLELVSEISAIFLGMDNGLGFDGRLEGVAVRLDFDKARVEVDDPPEERG